MSGISSVSNDTIVRNSDEYIEEEIEKINVMLDKFISLNIITLKSIITSV